MCVRPRLFARLNNFLSLSLTCQILPVELQNSYVLDESDYLTLPICFLGVNVSCQILLMFVGWLSVSGVREAWIEATTVVNGLNHNAVNVLSKSDSDARPFHFTAFIVMCDVSQLTQQFVYELQ